jgi:hypothetical protein
VASKESELLILSVSLELKPFRTFRVGEIVAYEEEGGLLGDPEATQKHEGTWAMPGKGPGPGSEWQGQG